MRNSLICIFEKIFQIYLQLTTNVQLSVLLFFASCDSHVSLLLPSFKFRHFGFINYDLRTLFIAVTLRKNQHSKGQIMKEIERRKYLKIFKSMIQQTHNDITTNVCMLSFQENVFILCRAFTVILHQEIRLNVSTSSWSIVIVTIPSGFLHLCFFTYNSCIMSARGMKETTLISWWINNKPNGKLRSFNYSETLPGNGFWESVQIHLLMTSCFLWIYKTNIESCFLFICCRFFFLSLKHFRMLTKNLKVFSAASV